MGFQADAEAEVLLHRSHGHWQGTLRLLGEPVVEYSLTGRNRAIVIAEGLGQLLRLRQQGDAPRFRGVFAEGAPVPAGEVYGWLRRTLTGTRTGDLLPAFAALLGVPSGAPGEGAAGEPEARGAPPPAVRRAATPRLRRPGGEEGEIKRFFAALPPGARVSFRLRGTMAHRGRTEGTVERVGGEGVELTVRGARLTLPYDRFLPGSLARD